VTLYKFTSAITISAQNMTFTDVLLQFIGFVDDSIII